jgi:PTH2 family peptidyl-tRNA hydrolase
METFTKSLTLPIWQVVGLCVGTAAAISSAAYFVRSKRATSKVIPPRKKGEQGEDVEVDSEDEEYEFDGEAVQYSLIDAPYKMVLCVNTSLKMDKGKIAAQCGHATLGAYKASMKHASSNVKWWERTGQAKIAVKVTEEQMHAASAAAGELGLISYTVMDAGRTQIAAGSLTVCAIGPAPVHVIDAITKPFKLL